MRSEEKKKIPFEVVKRRRRCCWRYEGVRESELRLSDGEEASKKAQARHSSSTAV